MKKAKIGFLLYENIIGNKNAASSRIRGKWLIKYWPEAEEFVYGRKYEVVIYQKCYPVDHAKLFKGIKILDLADPDHTIREPIIEMMRYCDAMTVSSEALRDFYQTMIDKPVVFIDDRQDLEYLKEKKQHKGRAKEVVWYGYSHNSHVLKAVLPSLERLKLGLSIISDSMTTVTAYSKERREKRVKERWIKWNLDKVNREIIKSDIVIMPSSMKPNDRFKSLNKTTNAWALGMPVANTADDLEKFLSEEARKKEAEKNLKIVKEKFDVRISVQEMKDLINKLKNDKLENRKA